MDDSPLDPTAGRSRHFEDLRPPQWQLAPARDVRRRGESLRRRRIAVTTAATLVWVGGLASAGVATGVLARPATTPVAGPDARPVVWRDTVPAGFDLAAGLPAASPSSASRPGSPSLAACGSRADDGVAPDEGIEPVTWRRVDVVDAGVLHEQRTLVLYPSANDAHRAVAGARSRLDDCLDGAAAQPDVRRVPSSALPGEEAMAYWTARPHAGSTDPVRELMVAVRLGNALLIDHARLGPAAVAFGRDVVAQTRRLQPVVRQMCVFAADPC